MERPSKNACEKKHHLKVYSLLFRLLHWHFRVSFRARIEKPSFFRAGAASVRTVQEKESNAIEEKEAIPDRCAFLHVCSQLICFLSQCHDACIRDGRGSYSHVSVGNVFLPSGPQTR